MKKLLTAAAMTAMIGTAAQADFLRVEMGAGVWNNELSGNIQYDGNTAFDANTLGYSDENRGYLWIFIKHPVPIIPNIRLEYAEVKFSGTSSQDFEWNNDIYTAGASSNNDLTQIDAILYYNILDNTAWATLDLGLDIKYIDSSFNATGEVLGVTETFDESEKLLLPLAYGRVRFEIPSTDIGIEGDIKYISYKNSGVMDYRIKADYTLVDVLPIDIGLEVGYRFENIELQSDDFSGLDSSLDLDVDGIFAGAVVRF